MATRAPSHRLTRALARAGLLARTPVPILMDRLGLMRRPYKVAVDRDITVELRPGVHGERYVYYEVFMKSVYFAAGQVLRPGDAVIDVGANVGFFAIQAAARVGPTGSVVAFEPQPDTFAQLQRNIAASGMRNIRARQAAVTGQTGSAVLFFGDTPIYSSLFRSVDTQSRDASSVEVPTTAIEDIMREEGLARCHYLKMDCEGGEYAICRSLSVDVAARIDQITMEVHRVPGHDVASLERSLTDLGYRVHRQDKLFSFTRRQT
jgi:FkbM family methyltransferase